MVRRATYTGAHNECNPRVKIHRTRHGGGSEWSLSVGRAVGSPNSSEQIGCGESQNEEHAVRVIAEAARAELRTHEHELLAG